MPLNLIAAALLTASATRATAPDTAAATLETSAPWLGEALWVRIDGLESGSPVTLWASAAAAEVPTPIGLLELDLASATPLVTTYPVQDGSVQLAYLLPPEAALAEAELHLQGLALAPQAPGGALLTQAAHLRLLSSRVVIEQHQIAEFGGPLTQRLQVRSALDLELVYELPLAAEADRLHDLHLSPDAHWAAWSAALGSPGPSKWTPTVGRVLRFEHMFGSSWSETPLVTRGEWVEAPWGDAWLVYGHDPTIGPGWDLFSLPYDPALPPTPLAIGGVPGPWVPELSADAAWIPTTPTPAGALQVKRVSLTTGATLATVEIAELGQTTLEWLELDGQRLIASSTRGQTGPDEANQRLSWLDWATVPSTLQTSTLGRQYTRYDGRLSLTDELLVWGWRVPGFPAIFVDAFLIEAADPAAALQVLDLHYLPNSPTVVVDQGQTVWVFDACCDDPPDGDGPATLWLLDPIAGVMLPPGGSLFPPYVIESSSYRNYVSMAAIDDFTGSSLLFGGSILTHVPYNAFEDQLMRLDPFTGASETVSTGFWANQWIETAERP